MLLLQQAAIEAQVGGGLGAWVVPPANQAAGPCGQLAAQGDVTQQALGLVCKFPGVPK